MLVLQDSIGAPYLLATVTEAPPGVYDGVYHCEIDLSESASDHKLAGAMPVGARVE